MSKNLDRTRNAQVCVPAPVPAGTQSGDVIIFGSGLTAWALTNRVTAVDLGNSQTTPPQGLVDGEASVELIGISTSVNLSIAVAVAFGDRIFKTGGTYDATTTGTFVGFALATTTAAATVAVGLARV